MSAGETIRHAFAIAGKDLRDTLRSKPALVILVLSPLVLMVLLGYVFPSVGAIKDAPLAVVNADLEAADPDSPSNVFIGRLAAENEKSGAFEMLAYDTEDEAREALRSKDVRGVLIVPESFSADQRHGGLVIAITILYDQSNPAIGRLVAGEAARLVEVVSAEDGRENVRAEMGAGSDEAVSAFMRPYVSDVRTASAAPPSYFQFLAPGLMTMTAVTAVMTGLPTAFRKERTQGTLDTLLVAPVGRWTLILGKILAQVARAFLQAGVVVALAMLLFGVTIAGSVVLLTLTFSLVVASFVGLGVLLTALAADEDGSSLGSFLFLPFLFLSGAVFPLDQLPAALQLVSRLIPLSYAVTAMRKVMVLGAGVGEILPELAILAVFGAATIAIAGRVFIRAYTR